MYKRPLLGVSLGFVVMMLFSVGVAAESTPLSLAEAVKIALQEDVGHKIAQVNWENAKIAYEKSLASNLLTESTYNSKLAELNLMKSETTYRDSVADVVLNTVNQFCDLREAELELKIKEQQLALRKKQLDLVRQKVATQNASELDLLEAEAALGSSELDYQRAQDSLLEKKQSLALLLNCEDVMVDGILRFVPFEANLDEVVAQVLQDSVSVKEAEEDVAVAELDLERKLLEEAAELDVREARNNLTLARLKLQQTRDNILRNVTMSYNAVNQAVQNYNLAQQNYELEKKKYDITKKQVAAGLKTQQDLANGMIDLLGAEKALYNALRNYVVSYLEFEKITGRDVTASAVLKAPQAAEGK